MILNVFKEKGWTSFDVVAKIKGILRENYPNWPKGKLKVGHAGTLDPLARGVLIVLTGEDTKKQQEIMKFDKEYICEISFGAVSDTYDLEGDLKYNEIPRDLNIEVELKKLIKNYLGEIQQRVPPYSAVKKEGKRLYKEARRGKIILEKDLPVKKVLIREIKLIDFYEKDGLPTANLKVVCGSGTYIRSIAHDLGEDLGVGGVLVNLVRTRIGTYDVDDSSRISELEEQLKV